MPTNPKLLKKLNNPATVAAAGRKAILREEFNSIRSELRTATTALLSYPAAESVGIYCEVVRELLAEYENLATLMMEDNSKESKDDQA